MVRMKLFFMKVVQLRLQQNEAMLLVEKAGKKLKPL
jgi:hypothetical protein